MNQRQLALRVGRHPSTVNGYLTVPEMMPESFIMLVSEKIPELSGAWMEYRRLVESEFMGITKTDDHETRRHEIRETAAALKDAIDNLLRQVDRLADVPKDEPAKPGRSQPARRRRG